MQTLEFPSTKITPSEDSTERHWSEVASLARDFEQAAHDAKSPGRCAQLHERLRACLQTLNDADDVVRACWDALLSKGLD